VKKWIEGDVAIERREQILSLALLKVIVLIFSGLFFRWIAYQRVFSNRCNVMACRHRRLQHKSRLPHFTSFLKSVLRVMPNEYKRLKEV
jgi:hypothetical protein